MVIIVQPIPCKDCRHLRGKMDDECVLTMDRCHLYDCEITDEMLENPCKNYSKR